MTKEEARRHIGDRVLYDGKFKGTIQAVRLVFVIVLYDGDMVAKATCPEDLELIT